MCKLTRRGSHECHTREEKQKKNTKTNAFFAYASVTHSSGQERPGTVRIREKAVALACLLTMEHVPVDPLRACSQNNSLGEKQHSRNMLEMDHAGQCRAVFVFWSSERGLA